MSRPAAETGVLAGAMSVVMCRAAAHDSKRRALRPLTIVRGSGGARVGRLVARRGHDYRNSKPDSRDSKPDPDQPYSAKKSNPVTYEVSFSAVVTKRVTVRSVLARLLRGVWSIDSDELIIQNRDIR